MWPKNGLLQRLSFLRRLETWRPWTHSSHTALQLQRVFHTGFERVTVTEGRKIQSTYIRLNSIDTIHPSPMWAHKVTFSTWAANMGTREGTGFQSINTNKSKPFLKIKGAVNLQKLYLQLLQRPFEFSRKKKTHLHTTTSVYVQLLVYLWFHRCL